MQAKVQTVQSTGNLIGGYSNFTPNNQSARLAFKYAVWMMNWFSGFSHLDCNVEEASNRMCIPILSLPRKGDTISFGGIIQSKNSMSIKINNLKVPFKCRFLNKQTESNANWSAILKWLMGIKSPPNIFVITYLWPLHVSMQEFSPRFEARSSSVRGSSEAIRSWWRLDSSQGAVSCHCFKPCIILRENIPMVTLHCVCNCFLEVEC